MMHDTILFTDPSGLVLNEGIGRTPDGVTSNLMDENSVGMEDECEINDEITSEIHAKNFV
jgi:hypothetical protein